MADQKKLVVRVGKSKKNGNLYFSVMFFTANGYQINLGFINKDKVAEMLDISVRYVDTLECKDYEVI